MLCPARFFGIAEDSGDEFTYYIRTESKYPRMLMRSNVKSRILNIGEKNERISNKSENFQFWLGKFVDGPSKPSHLQTKNDVIFPPPPGNSIPDGPPPSPLVQAPEQNSIQNDAEQEMHVPIINQSDPDYDELKNALDVTPISRSSIDEADLPTPDKEICCESKELLEESADNDNPEIIPPSVSQDVINEFEHVFDNHTCKEILNHSMSDGVLMFEVLTVDKSKIFLPNDVLKEDNPCD